MDARHELEDLQVTSRNSMSTISRYPKTVKPPLDNKQSQDIPKTEVCALASSQHTTGANGSAAAAHDATSAAVGATGAGVATAGATEHATAGEGAFGHQED